MARINGTWSSLRKDPLLLGLIGLIFLALVPMPFLAYRLLNSGGGGNEVVLPVLPTETPTPTATPLPTATPTPTPTPEPTPTPLIVLAPLSGLEVDPEVLTWPPIAVMIPSDSDQYAMAQASVVFEASAEFSIQRFLAIFEYVQAEKIGPIRSARPYYVDWACAYGLIYVHWGGSPQAYEKLDGIECLHELDGMSESFPFWRAEVVDIPWNNGFTDSDSLYASIERRGWTRTVDYQGYLHKEDALLGQRPLTGTISMGSAFRFSVRYDYDRQSNTYVREFKGRPHLDLLTGEQHHVHNVVVVWVPEAPIPDDPKGRLEIQTIGEGDALVFRDGLVIPGRWVKETPELEMRFYDEDGQEIGFNRGNIWIEVVAEDATIEYDFSQPPP